VLCNGIVLEGKWVNCLCIKREMIALKGKWVNCHLKLFTDSDDVTNTTP